MKETILLIEDDRIMRISLEDALKGLGYEVLTCETGAAGLELSRNAAVDLVITDVRLPDMDGFDIAREISGRKTAPVIMMTAYGTIKDAVEAMKLGAFDYITKPFSLEEFLLLVERALEINRLRAENIRLKNDLHRCYSAPNIIGESSAIKHLFSLIAKVAETDATVLILGESGTGKELVATTIHYQSNRREKPLIRINCAALPEGLVESELFGHEKGAFTGAVKRKPGRFELAQGGTIFLDEIGDLPLPAQAKLLRVLQEKTVERVGGTGSIKIDVRLLAATNKGLEDEVKEGRFREDLFYRLNVIPVTIPPLRERKEDIPALIEFFMDKFRARLARKVRFAPEALDMLLSYDYPGNVRELENIIERCVTLSAAEVISRAELPLLMNTGGGLKTDGQSLSDVAAAAERGHIIRTLQTTQGNKTKAAELLGISRKTLWEKINSYGIR